jgi:hypothetical protein
MAATQCDFQHEVWGPHEGCKEFMDEPETFRCQNNATMIHTLTEAGPDYPDYRWVTWVTPLAACDEHPFDPDPALAYCAPTLLYSLPINGDEV